MSGSQWRKVKRLDHGVLHEARLQPHYAVQWLARAARAYVTPRPDDGHTNFGWEDALGGLTTHPLSQGSVVGLEMTALTLRLWDGPGRAGGQAISLDGRRDADIREWLGGQLGTRGLDPAALDAPSPYQMPDHPVGHGAPYAAAALGEALGELAAWFANANDILSETRQRITARGIAAPPARCWPHHFDLDSLISLGSGPGARTVGLGFSPGDDYYDEPYFYISAYPAPDLATLPSLPSIGHWHTHHFTAAVAVADRIIAADDPQAATITFVHAAADILIARS
ncbi:MAG TPA: DUF5996 family protein [Xanthobacteraceae bacterium]